MHFASPLPWWLVVVVAAGVAGVAVFSYRRPLVPLARAQQVTLIVLRALTLAAVVILLCRPVLLLPPVSSGGAVIPILVDASRSMRIADADGQSRIARARQIAATLAQDLASQATVEVFTVADTLTPAPGGTLTPGSVGTPTPGSAGTLSVLGHRTDLTGALAAVRDRYRGRPVPGVFVLSDGGDTGQAAQRDRAAEAGPPVFAIGIGSSEGLPDRELVSITAGDPRLDRASVDLRVSAVSRGFGRVPAELRVLANGQVVSTRTVTPTADGSPIDELFTVSPEAATPTVFSAEIAAADGETVTENNARSVLVNPAARKRLVLELTGAPGYEHSFLNRALSQDPGLEIDSVVRKGQNETGADTFLVQAGGGRAPALLNGFPGTREALFAYDALVLANIEGDFFKSAQLGLAADFVAERGGGLLVLGARSFEQRSLIGSPLEPVLPLELNDRRDGAREAATGEEAPALQNVLTLTPEGENHPIMRLGATIESSRKAWALLPPLAANAAVGGPRPGASVLALTATPAGIPLPVVAVQRYGRGRSMVFAGEASWRWRMLRPSTDRSYDMFWRQAVRWLSAEAPGPVAVSVPADPQPGDPLTVEIEVRDRAYQPVTDGTLTVNLTTPGGDKTPLTARAVGSGRYEASVTPDAPGVYRVNVEAVRGTTPLGAAERWVNVGGNDNELADPRLNEGFLRRLARESGGRYVRASEASSLASDLQSSVPSGAQPVRRDLWHEPWTFALVLALASAEWILRRRWGLR